MTLTLRGLAEAPEEVQAEVVSSRTAAMRALRKGAVVTAAGHMGALNVWKTERGSWYRCERMTFGTTDSMERCKDLREVEDWLRRNFPKIGSNKRPVLSFW